MVKTQSLNRRPIVVSGSMSVEDIIKELIKEGIEIKAETAEDIVINEPSRLLILVPTTLSAGTYELSITTQSSTGSTLLKEPRTDTLGVNITIS